jgi:hypothetical protein
MGGSGRDEGEEAQEHGLEAVGLMEVQDTPPPCEVNCIPAGFTCGCWLAWPTGLGALGVPAPPPAQTQHEVVTAKMSTGHNFKMV